jgi:hypothetical protein
MVPSQSLSSPSQRSASGAIPPTQAPQAPSTQVCVPSSQVPSVRPQEVVLPSMQEQPVSVAPSQLLSRPSQRSGAPTKIWLLLSSQSGAMQEAVRPRPSPSRSSQAAQEPASGMQKRPGPPAMSVALRQV